MAVYVDDVRLRFGRMVMCHMWADNEAELHAFAAMLGLKRAWFQQPPKASWQHYDISLSIKKRALEMGAILTDKYGPVEFEARRRGDQQKLDLIAGLRAKRVGAHGQVGSETDGGPSH